MKIAKERTVAFSGHRTDKIIQENGDVNLPNVIASETYKVVLSLCEKGYNSFLTGMAEGFDLIAGEAVLKARQTYPHIKLIAVIPFQGQELSYSVEDKSRYKLLYENVAEQIFTSDTYHKEAFFVRNDYLLAHASVLVCYYIAGKRSGTMYTVNRAIKTNMETINLRILLSNYINDK